MANYEKGQIIKIKHDVDRTYEWKILDIAPKDYDTFSVRVDVFCPCCNLEGQFWWQSIDKLRLEFYCPNCNITWSIFVKEK